MQIQISKQILEKYRDASIGYLLAKVQVEKSAPYVEELKATLLTHVQNQGLNATNFAAHPKIAQWRAIYEGDFQVNPRTYRSASEALLRRILTGKALPQISTVVDLYNCCSILSLLPFGGYDVAKVCGDIEIRYANEGELFRGIGSTEVIEAKTHQIVYADSERCLCWLWNHKDAAATCIDANTKTVLFFIDSALAFEQGMMESALDLLSDKLHGIGATILTQGLLSEASPSSSCDHVS